MGLLSDGRSLEPAVDYRGSWPILYFRPSPPLLLGLPRGTLKYFYRTDSGALRRFIG